MRDVAESRVEEWRTRLEKRIWPEVRTMYLRRDVFQGVGRMVGGGELPPSYFWQYLGDTYAATQAPAIRRQADTRKDVASLATLLKDIRDNADYMTRESYLTCWAEDPHDQQYAANRFDAWSAGSGGKHLDPTIPDDDLKALAATSASTKTYVDRYLAHSADDRDHEGRSDVPTFDEIDGAVDQIGTLFQKYVHLLTAVDQMLHTILPNDWFRIFHRPWLRPGVTPPVVPPPGVH
jgi:hypothetical protein